MRRPIPTAILCLAILSTTMPASPATIKGSSTLKDLQPTGTNDQEHKHQAYDLSFQAEGKTHTCRTDPKKSVNATDFVVGSQISYEVDKQKGKIKTSENKEVECKIVRVEMVPATP
jgi:hypothetical protein